MRLALIAGMTFREAARKKVLWMALAAGIAFLALFGTALHFQTVDIARNVPPALRPATVNFFLMMGLYAADLLSVVMTVVISADTLSGEIASGTIQSVATRPIARWHLFLGKWIGCAGIVAVYLVLMIGGTAVLGWRIGGTAARHAVLGFGLIALECAVVLTLTLLCGTVFSTLATAVVVLGLHGLAFLGGWIEQAGALIGSHRTVTLGIVTSVVMPSESLWRRAVFVMQSPVTSALNLGPFSAASVPSRAMVAYAGAYIAAGIALAIWRFDRRDL